MGEIIRRIKYILFGELEPKCEACEVLKSEIEYLKYQNQQLLDKLITPTETESPRVETPRAIIPSRTPWRVKKAQLEAEDRHKAKVTQSIEELEKEVLHPVGTDATQ
jgi:hypothetical protein